MADSVNCSYEDMTATRSVDSGSTVVELGLEQWMISGSTLKRRRLNRQIKLAERAAGALAARSHPGHSHFLIDAYYASQTARREGPTTTTTSLQPRPPAAHLP